MDLFPEDQVPESVAGETAAHHAVASRSVAHSLQMACNELWRCPAASRREDHVHPYSSSSRCPLPPGAPSPAAQLEAEAAHRWELYFRRNPASFKDRNWFNAEFPELLRASTVLEVGCGIGSTVLPLLRLNPAARVWACDLAPRAVELTRARLAEAPPQAAARVEAFVADITRDDLVAAGVPAAGVDVCTMVGGWAGVGGRGGSADGRRRRRPTWAACSPCYRPSPPPAPPKRSTRSALCRRR